MKFCFNFVVLSSFKMQRKKVTLILKDSYLLTGSFLLKSNLSDITLKETRHILPSSSSKAMCPGPSTMRFTLVRRFENAACEVCPNRFRRSATSFNLINRAF